jgi:hypothetical protein
MSMRAAVAEIWPTSCCFLAARQLGERERAGGQPTTALLGPARLESRTLNTSAGRWPAAGRPLVAGRIELRECQFRSACWLAHNALRELGRAAARQALRVSPANKQTQHDTKQTTQRASSLAGDSSTRAAAMSRWRPRKKERVAFFSRSRALAFLFSLFLFSKLTWKRDKLRWS